MARLEIERIGKRFGTTDILKSIDLDIADGEFISLVGPSGCGKSTLLRIISGLEQQSEGHIRLGGNAVDNLRPRDRDLAMVFQSYALYPHLSVEQNIAVPLTMRRLGSLQRLPFVGALLPGVRQQRKTIASDVDAICESLSIAPLKNRKPAALSGGQRQRVALARAMVRQPSAFLMDEPLSNLDAKMRVQARAEIAALHRKLATTFVYVTHDQAEAMTMSDRIAVLMEGRLLQVGSPDEIYSKPQDLRVAQFIGSPVINTVEGHEIDGRFVGMDRNGEACSTGEPVHLAFRPEAARLTAPGAGMFAGRVRHLENLGSEIFVQAETTDARTLTIRLQPETPRPGIGETIGIDVDARHFHVFSVDLRRRKPVFLPGGAA
ncbi:ABC transporter ATP-binding protein [Ochrobactrum sp. XJ1]|nr:ABC transporter ATP-binding protein [Ochrobactrum sp. XJ1]